MNYNKQQVCIKWSMKINFDKSKVLTPFVDNILLQGEHIENVNNFIYLEVLCPMSKKKLNEGYHWLQKSVWSNKILLDSTYCHLCISSQTLAVADEKKFLVLKMQYLRSILGVSRLSRIRNIKIRSKWHWEDYSWC